MRCSRREHRIERDGLITLPPPRSGNTNGRHRPRFTPASNPQDPVGDPVGDAVGDAVCDAVGDAVGRLGDLTFRVVENRATSSLWNELIERYHDLGYKALPGARLLDHWRVSATKSLERIGRLFAESTACSPNRLFQRIVRLLSASLAEFTSPPDWGT